MAKVGLATLGVARHAPNSAFDVERRQIDDRNVLHVVQARRPAGRAVVRRVQLVVQHQHCRPVDIVDKVLINNQTLKKANKQRRRDLDLRLL